MSEKKRVECPCVCVFVEEVKEEVESVGCGVRRIDVCVCVCVRVNIRCLRVCVCVRVRAPICTALASSNAGRECPPPRSRADDTRVAVAPGRPGASHARSIAVSVPNSHQYREIQADADPEARSMYGLPQQRRYRPVEL